MQIAAIAYSSPFISDLLVSAILNVVSGQIVKYSTILQRVQKIIPEQDWVNDFMKA